MSAPEGSTLHERAVAVRPVGMTVGRTRWDAVLYPLPSSGSVSTHRITHEGSTRVAFDSLLLEVAYSGWFLWVPDNPTYPGYPPDQLVVGRMGNPEIGARFRDSPAPDWRIEIGGALALPATSGFIWDGREPPPPPYHLFPALPLDNLFAWRGLGWNAHRMAEETVTLIAQARAEWDALPQLVVALEASVPVLLGLDGGVAAYPQVALDVAGRFLAHQLVGVRAELTTYTGSSGEAINVLLEPFARFVLFDPVAAPFVRLALRLPVGPAFPLMGVGDRGFGYFGGSLSVGALY